MRVGVIGAGEDVCYDNHIRNMQKTTGCDAALGNF